MNRIFCFYSTSTHFTTQTIQPNSLKLAHFSILSFHLFIFITSMFYVLQWFSPKDRWFWWRMKKYFSSSSFFGLFVFAFIRKIWTNFFFFYTYKAKMRWIYVWMEMKMINDEVGSERKHFHKDIEKI